MKRSICFALCAIYVSILPVYGNSAPSYWEAFPYSEVLVVESDSPITIDREHLTFDFSKTYDDGNNNSPVGKVTADYQMTNPTDDTLTVQMAFPFVEDLYSLSISDIAISADGAAIPYEIYVALNDINTSVDSGHINTFDDSREEFVYDYGTIGHISKQEWSLPGFDLNSEAKLYRFAISGNAEERLDFEISFNVDHDQTLLMGNDFDVESYSEEGSEKLSSRIRENTELELLVLGKDPGFTYEVFTDAGEKAEQDRYQLEIIQDSVDPKEYLLAAIREEVGEDTASAISDVQLLNLILHELCQGRLNNGYSTMYEGFSALHETRFLTLVYQVEFPTSSTRSVSVGYLTDGTMDRRETVSPKYSYTYLLSPAKNWADFGSLDIEVVTPREAPDMIENSLGLLKDGENRYSARLDGSPKSELTFTLYEKEAITFIDKTERALVKASYLLYFLWPVIVIFLVVITVLVVRAIRRIGRGETMGM